MRALLWFIVGALLALPGASAQTFYTYIGQIESHSVLIAWGITARTGNTIGRNSTSHGNARVSIGGQTLQTTQNWIVASNLQADTQYTYQVTVNDQKVGDGKVRTYPEQTRQLCFFLIGDFGNGTEGQYRIADAMTKEYQRRATSTNPPRFVLTVGDNIYADVSLGAVKARSGDADAHWDAKFFRPYKQILQEIPFYPTLGNHDGNGSENQGDLGVYLDNFFFPHNQPARWYNFSFGGLADFFALDSTDNQESGPPAPVYKADGEQVKWLQQALAASHAPWKIPYLHHPIYNAGPRHPASLDDLRAFVDAFQRNGVRVVFSGHEHNYQFSKMDGSTGNIRYVLSGSAGELRAGDVRRKMDKANIEGWAAQRQFLVVEIQDRTMTVTPQSYDEMKIVDRNGKPLPPALTVPLP